MDLSKAEADEKWNGVEGEWNLSCAIPSSTNPSTSSSASSPSQPDIKRRWRGFIPATSQKPGLRAPAGNTQTGQEFAIHGASISAPLRTVHPREAAPTIRCSIVVVACPPVVVQSQPAHYEPLLFALFSPRIASIRLAKETLRERSSPKRVASNDCLARAVTTTSTTTTLRWKLLNYFLHSKRRSRYSRNHCLHSDVSEVQSESIAGEMLYLFSSLLIFCARSFVLISSISRWWC